MRIVRNRFLRGLVTTAVAGSTVFGLINTSAAPAHASADTTFTLVAQGDGAITQPAMSADGRYVAFTSAATSLGGDGFHTFVYVHDRQADTNEMVSVGAASVAADEDSRNPAISADGRFVVFDSFATNLPGSVYTNENIYVRDRVAGTTTNLTNTQSPPRGPGGLVSYKTAISADGSTVAFDTTADLIPSDTNHQTDIYVVRNGVLSVASTDSAGAQSTGASQQPALSGDGRYVVFTNYGNDLVPGDTNGFADVFRKDLDTGAIILISHTNTGGQANSYSSDPEISSDGRYVVYSSQAQNIIHQPSPFSIATHPYRYDVQNDTVEFVDVTGFGRENIGLAANTHDATISADGRYATFLGQSTQQVPAAYLAGTLVYLKDFQTGILKAMSVDHVGNTGEVAFDTPDDRADVTNSGTVSFTSVANGSPYRSLFVRELGPASTVAPTAAISTDNPNPRINEGIGLNLTVDAPDAQILDYAIDYGDGTPSFYNQFYIATDDHHAYIAHSYTTPGDYTVTATMRDDDGRTFTATRLFHVRASNAAPAASLSVTPSTGVAPLTVQLDASGSTDNDGTITNYTFSFGDGTANTSGNATSVSHQYTTPGTYYPTVTTTDNDGATSEAQRVVTITPAAITSVKGKVTYLSQGGGKPKAKVTVNVNRKLVKHVLTYVGSFTYTDPGIAQKGTCTIKGTTAVARAGFDNGAVLTVTCKGGKTGPQANLTGTGTITIFDASALGLGQTDHIQFNVGGTLNWTTAVYFPTTSTLSVLPIDPTNNGGGGGGSF